MKVMVIAGGTLKSIRKVNNDCHLIAMIKRLKNDSNISKVLTDYDSFVKGDKDYDSVLLLCRCNKLEDCSSHLSIKSYVIQVRVNIGSNRMCS